jgi:alginate O-acetyltransferase complex protein AlgI
MTLSGWFREYLYFPLGGSRVGTARQYWNLFIVWAATGLWHGASWNFVLWGLYFFVLISCERLFLKQFLDRHRLLSHLYLIFAVVLGWVLFAITDMNQMGVFLSRLFCYKGGNDWVFFLRNYAVILLLGAVMSTPWLRHFSAKYPKLARLLGVPFLLAVFLLSVAYLVDSTYNPFLYFRF